MRSARFPTKCDSTPPCSKRRLRELAPHAAGDARALDRLARRPVEGPAPTARSPEAREVLATFRAMRDIQDRLGTSACERVIVSFTRSAADLASRRRSSALPIVKFDADRFQHTVAPAETWCTLGGRCTQ